MKLGYSGVPTTGTRVAQLIDTKQTITYNGHSLSITNNGPYKTLELWHSFETWKSTLPFTAATFPMPHDCTVRKEDRLSPPTRSREHL